jgi:hypothetical protein
MKVDNSLVNWFDETYGKMTKQEIQTKIKTENKKFKKMKKEHPQLPFIFESVHAQNIQFLNRRLSAFND